MLAWDRVDSSTNQPTTDWKDGISSAQLHHSSYSHSLSVSVSVCVSCREIVFLIATKYITCHYLIADMCFQADSKFNCNIGFSACVVGGWVGVRAGRFFVIFQEVVAFWFGVYFCTFKFVDISFAYGLRIFISVACQSNWKTKWQRFNDLPLSVAKFIIWRRANWKTCRLTFSPLQCTNRF